MKSVILSLFFVGAVVAELPRFRPARFRFQRQELAPTTTESPTEATTEPSGPYPASGWKPSEPFELPSKTPDNGAPQNTAPYPPSGWKPSEPFELPQQPPSTSYGVPDSTYGAPEASTTEATTTGNPQMERLENLDVQKSVGTYFLVLPNGELQKVEAVLESDQNMKYSARLLFTERAPLIVLRTSA